MSVNAWGALLAWVSACTFDIDDSAEAAAAVRAQDLGDLPYHPLVLHLDLSILAYQLYAQSIVWPFDPYYEELTLGRDARAPFIDLVRAEAAAVGAAQVAAGTGLDALRGPGVLSGFPDNPAHDPILYQYSRLHPWSDAVTNDIHRWIEYRTPRVLTDPIADVWVCARTIGAPEGDVTVTPVPRRDGIASSGRDVLLVFEGGTGDKGEPGQPPSQSLMGFALLRYGSDDVPDLHVAFRGSRSGSGSRAALDAISTDAASGNPDWITDLGVRPIDAPTLSTVGRVARGMTRTIETVLPTLFRCLDEGIGQRAAVPPAQIYVTGHSLGGGLAQLFTSAVLLGDAYGPGGGAMPASVVDWPWDRVKLISFAAPRVGDAAWAEALTTDQLDMPFFGYRYSYDYDALGTLDPAIVPRLIDPDRPAGFRVLVPTDPITSSFLVTGFHVGETVYVALPSQSDPPGTEDHEPQEIRRWMTEALRDPDRIPGDVWRYVPLDAWTPDRDEEAAGTPAEYGKLIEATRRYHDERGLWWDRAAFDAEVGRFTRLLDRL